MGEEKGRPKNLRRVHIHKVDEDTQEWAEDLITKGLGIHEGTGVLKAYLGTNVGAATATLAIIVGLLAWPPTQAAMTSLIAFIRMQIAGIAKDIAAEFIPTPEEIVDEVAEAARRVAEAARKAVQRALEERNRRLRELREQDPRREDGEIPPSDAPTGPPIFPP